MRLFLWFSNTAVRLFFVNLQKNVFHPLSCSIMRVLSQRAFSDPILLLLVFGMNRLLEFVFDTFGGPSGMCSQWVRLAVLYFLCHLSNFSILSKFSICPMFPFLSILSNFVHLDYISVFISVQFCPILSMLFKFVHLWPWERISHGPISLKIVVIVGDLRTTLWFINIMNFYNFTLS